MAGLRWPPEDSDLAPSRPPATAPDLVSDDDRSVAADSWSIKSEYGSTLDDDQRHVDASDPLLSASNLASSVATASDYSSDKDGPEADEIEASELGLQSYWDAAYAEDLANFDEHGHAGEVWFGTDVMDSVVSWTKNLCTNLSKSQQVNGGPNCNSESGDPSNDLSSWNVLDLGTGNGLLLQELAKHGFTDLTGTDYSEGAIVLARNLASRNGFQHIKFLVDDILETKLDRKYKLVMDKGTLDAIGLHPDGPVKRALYWESVSNLVSPGGILVVTSCNNTKDELLQEVKDFNRKSLGSEDFDCATATEPTIFQYIDHVRTYPTIMFGGVEGSRVCTVAFLRC